MSDLVHVPSRKQKTLLHGEGDLGRRNTSDLLAGFRVYAVDDVASCPLHFSIIRVFLLFYYTIPILLKDFFFSCFLLEFVDVEEILHP